MGSDDFLTVDGYIARFPGDVQERLERIRTIHEAAPGAEEKISYKVPTITVDGKYVVYFADWKHHISLYPLPALDPAVEEELRPYRSAKGTIKFSLDRPIPYDLVARVVKLLVEQRRPRTTRPSEGDATAAALPPGSLTVVACES